MTKYWVVGATWDGQDKADEFVENGIWMLGWDQGPQHENAKNMKKGDRIAIKRRTGHAGQPLTIQHIGIIQGIVLDSERVVCTVNWVATNVDREISDSRGCMASVRGFGHDAWVEKVFCL